MMLDGGAPSEGATAEADGLRQATRSGANWFYWIAGLSLVNSVVQLFGSDYNFIIGLGITQVLDAFAQVTTESVTGSTAAVVRGAALFLDVLVAGVFSLFGLFAGRGRGWAFVVGMILYALDGLIFLFVQEWMSLGFHAFALYGIWAGYSSLRKLQTLGQSVEPVPAPGP